MASHAASNAHCIKPHHYQVGVALSVLLLWRFTYQVFTTYSFYLWQEPVGPSLIPLPRWRHSQTALAHYPIPQNHPAFRVQTFRVVVQGSPASPAHKTHRVCENAVGPSLENPNVNRSSTNQAS